MTDYEYQKIPIVICEKAPRGTPVVVSTVCPFCGEPTTTHKQIDFTESEGLPRSGDEGPRDSRHAC